MATELECENFIALHGAAIMAIGGVQGIGIGEESHGSGRFHVNVYVGLLTQGIESQLPEQPTVRSEHGRVAVPVVVLEIGQLVIPRRMGEEPDDEPAGGDRTGAGI